ncbi:MAG: sensor histidine kinase [Luteolibacter sp.]
MRELLDSHVAIIQKQLAELPAVEPIQQFDAYGYHGGYLPALDKLPENPRWTVEIEYLPKAPISQAILVPAAERRFEGELSYGFPKRFRLSKVFPDGRVKPFAEWMNEDCPVRGRMPLIIDIPEPYAGTIRMDVFRGAMDGGRELFALDEFYCVADNDISHAMGISVSSEFESLPYWSKEFLVDQKTSLGLPLGASENGKDLPSEKTDFSIGFDPNIHQELTVELDLGENKRLHEMILIPAAYSDGILIPGFGFPRNISVRTYRENADGAHGQYSQWEEQLHLNPGQNALRLRKTVQNVRWVELTFSGFSNNGEEAVFSMGELIPRYKKQSHTVQNVRLLVGPPASKKEIQSLIDQKAAGRPVMFFLDWIQKVSERNHLSLRLEEKVALSVSLEERWRNFWWFWGCISLALIVSVAILITAYSVSQRRKHALLLRRQISSDLHDDIGSSMSAVSLAMRRLRRLSDNPQIHERCSKIDSILGNMQNSFQDVLWFTNSDTDTLRQMLSKLIHMAELYVPEDLLQLECTPLHEIPDRKLKVMFKRDLLLIYREALNNAVKHSGAKKIHVTFRCRRGLLELTISDDGKGFDLEEVSESQDNRPHLGLSSMRRRIERLHAKYSLQSEPGKGTTLRLSLSI